MASDEAHFLGYARQGRRAGVRNHLLILSILGLTGQAARRVARSLPGAVLVAAPYGRGQLGRDADAWRAQLIGLAANPNVGAALVIGADRGSADAVAEAAAGAGALVETATLDDVGEDALALSDRALRAGARMALTISRQRRVALPARELFVGVECGHSDATSGLAANPLAGACVDRLIDLGASAVIGETIEWLGAEHVLARRAATPAVANAIVAAVEARERAAAATGVDLTGANPGAENIRGGLSSIEEKSLGAIAKAGARPIRGLIGLGEPAPGAGLHVMDAPAFSPESLTGFAASGAQLMLFTTGPGNSYVSALAPTIKISAHPRTARRIEAQIDFDASAVLEGRETLADAADRLLALVLGVASGTRTFGEILDEGSETLARLGPSF